MRDSVASGGVNGSERRRWENAERFAKEDVKREREIQKEKKELEAIKGDWSSDKISDEKSSFRYIF